ncbi:TMEM175 family protein [Arthrobacter pigmenti]
MASSTVYRRGGAEFDRSLSFYDAIYAFALTLLIANVDAPEPEAWRSIGALLDSHLGGQLLGLLISFVVIVLFWLVNQRVVARMSGFDSTTTWLNIACAGFVILLPFTTQGISDPHTSDLALPTVFYAVNIALASLAQTSLYIAAERRGLVESPDPVEARPVVLVDWLMTPAIFLLSIPITLWMGATQGKLFWLLLAIVAPLTGRLAERRRRNSGPRQ